MKLRDEIRQTKPFASPEEEAYLNLQRTAEYLRAKSAAWLRPWDLSLTQYNVLRILRGAGKGGLACSEIGARMVTQDSDITRLLDRLEKKGLIERWRDERDRRVVMARATRQAVTLSSHELASLNSTLEKLRS
jgi:DNA-binding MarR family transcriptional regulator